MERALGLCSQPEAPGTLRNLESLALDFSVSPEMIPHQQEPSDPKRVGEYWNWRKFALAVARTCPRLRKLGLPFFYNPPPEQLDLKCLSTLSNLQELDCPNITVDDDWAYLRTAHPKLRRISCGRGFVVPAFWAFVDLYTFAELYFGERALLSTLSLPSEKLSLLDAYGRHRLQLSAASALAALAPFNVTEYMSDTDILALLRHPVVAQALQIPLDTSPYFLRCVADNRRVTLPVFEELVKSFAAPVAKAGRSVLFAELPAAYRTELSHFFSTRSINCYRIVRQRFPDFASYVRGSVGSMIRKDWISEAAEVLSLVQAIPDGEERERRLLTCLQPFSEFIDNRYQIEISPLDPLIDYIDGATAKTKAAKSPTEAVRCFRLDIAEKNEN